MSRALAVKAETDARVSTHGERASHCFFHEPARFERLRRAVFPTLAARKSSQAPVRVWVVGCATGEEVYSLAIALLEFLDDVKRPLTIFGTDLSQKAIDIARAGVYPGPVLRDLSVPLRARYFHEAEDGWRVRERVRVCCVFARHDLARDPPFSRLDVVSCPDLLSHLDRSLQRRVLSTFHHALADAGVLVLAETDLRALIERRSRPVAGDPEISLRTHDDRRRDAARELAASHDVLTRAELLSDNEDLRSLNEELTTAQEQLQVANEELRTVNQQLEHRNRDVARINRDLINVLATVDIPILILDSQRRVRRFTPTARRILSVIDTDIGRPFTDIRSNLDAPRLEQQVDEVIESGIGTESEVRDLDGHWHRLQIHPYRTLEDANDGAVISLIDIDGLKDLVQRAQRANQQAEQANRTKDEFLATLSHELRSPLHGMLAHAQLLRRGAIDEARVRRASETIEAGVLTLSHLIDDLLDVSRILNGKLRLNLRALDLADVVARAVETVADQCARRALHVSVQLPPPSAAATISGDALRLEQVMANLLANAIKFTPEDGAIVVSLARVSGRVVLTVRDTGVGIDAAFLPLVFQRFTQANTGLTREFGGLGLGLAIVRYFVEAHQGEVTAESGGPGLGAVFRVSFPLLELPADEGRAKRAQLAAASAPAPLLDGVRILVVDDDRAARQTVGEILRQAGAEVWSVPSAQDAMEAVSQFSPQLMLCDIAMPGEDGLSLMRRVRALEDAASARIPALALTALARSEDRECILGAGYQRHLVKPIDIEVLTRAVLELHAGAVASRIEGEQLA